MTWMAHLITEPHSRTTALERNYKDSERTTDGVHL